MDIHSAVIVDDVAADRQLAARVLQRAGWIVQTARNTVEGEAQIATLAQLPNAMRTVILTDLHMPRDPAHTGADRSTSAGARWALRLRAQMERSGLPRLPIVALTALTEHEILLTALAFGCDAVVPKPITPDLASRIQQALTEACAEDAEPVGADALLRLLRSRLADVLVGQPAQAPRLTEQEITKALLAYRRRGLVGLGGTVLAAFLAPHAASLVERGERTYAALVQHLDAIMQLGASASLTILQGELVHHCTPEEQCAEFGLSLSEYYRRRREAIAVLRDLLTH